MSVMSPTEVEMSKGEPELLPMYQIRSVGHRVLFLTNHSNRKHRSRMRLHFDQEAGDEKWGH